MSLFSSIVPVYTSNMKCVVGPMSVSFVVTSVDDI